MRKYILGIAALFIAVTAFFAFKTKEAKTPEVKKEAVPVAKRIPTPTWYEYIGAQTAPARKTPSNYVRHGATAPTCSEGETNECAVLLSSDVGPDASTADITFDGTSGMPVEGDDFVENRTKNL